MATDSSWLEEASALDCVQECDHEEDTGTVTYCGWFRGLYYRWSPSHGYDTCQEEQKDQVKDHHRNRLVVKELKEVLKGLKNVKAALVEILGVPKWKTVIFVRRLRWTCSCSSSSDGAKNKKKRMQFQYDPKSYALNFDDGIEKEGDDGVYLDFSARYACPLGINKEYLGLEVQIE